MGRRPGAKNKSKQEDVNAFIDTLAKKCGYDSFEELAATVAKDRKTRGTVVLKCMEYRFGKPIEKIAHSGRLDIYNVVAAARARVQAHAQQEQLTNGHDKSELVNNE